MKHIILLLLSITALCFQACNIVNPKESVPTYLKIDSVHLESSAPNIHGSVSHKITDVWVYYDRQLLGAYQLPAKIPILANASGQTQIVAGIWDDGLSGTRAKYPFFTVDTFTFSASPGNTVSHIPTFQYRTTDTPAVSYFIEDFEQGNSFTNRYGDTSFVKTNLPDEVFEGAWSSKLVLTDTSTYGESISVQPVTLPSSKMCYLELNYKSDVDIVLKVQVTTSSGGIVVVDLTGINASSKWNKIYYNFGGFPTAYQNASFKFILSASLPSGATHGKVLIDNFKIIHFN